MNPPVSPPPPDTWQELLRSLFERYHAMMTQHWTELTDRVGQDLAERTRNLSALAIEHLSSKQEEHPLSQASLTPSPPSVMGEDKANRWLGFVQGVVITAGLTSIEIERDFTRPYFHAIKGISPTLDARSCRP